MTMIFKVFLIKKIKIDSKRIYDAEYHSNYFNLLSRTQLICLISLFLLVDNLENKETLTNNSYIQMQTYRVPFSKEEIGICIVYE